MVQSITTRSVEVQESEKTCALNRFDRFFCVCETSEKQRWTSFLVVNRVYSVKIGEPMALPLLLFVCVTVAHSRCVECGSFELTFVRKRMEVQFICDRSKQQVSLDESTLGAIEFSLVQ